MGIHDSSLTRVVPVFNGLYTADPTGGKWLSRLLRLPVGGTLLSLSPGCRFTIRSHNWGDKDKKLREKQLDPPVALLSWIIRHSRPQESGGLSSDKKKAAIRQQWIDGSQQRIAEALELLRHNPKGEDWHIFEKPSQPDVFIETDDLIVVIEGKHTESKPTTTTKWMPGRHQMLRHIDCAWEIRGRKRVLGFFIVKGDDMTGEVPDKWVGFAAATTTPTAVASSLPHRGPEEQKAIASAFIGVTTWQKVCKKFEDLGLDYDSLPDTVDG